MNNLTKILNDYSYEKKINSCGSNVTCHEMRFFKKIYNLYPQHNDYDTQKFSNVVDNLHFHNEIKILNLLAKYDITPKIIYTEENTLYLTDCGEVLSKSNLPKNWKEQLINIYEILKSHFIYHNDIKVNNFTVKDNKIYLIDFGWASLYKPEYPYWNLTKEIITQENNIDLVFQNVFNLSMKTMGEIFVRNNNEINYHNRNLMK